jgi:hypothetical protein
MSVLLVKQLNQKQLNMSKQSTKQGPGRPKYSPDFPRKTNWTFIDFMEVNGVESNPESKKYGKGPNCTKLTLTKYLGRDMFYLFATGKRKGQPDRSRPRPNSTVKLVKDEFAEPNSENGLGRKGFIYTLRNKPAGQPKTTRKARTTRATSDVSPATKQYEELKAILAAPTPAPAAVTVPAVEVKPEPTPAPAPVASETATPVPEAQAAETAAVAAGATAPTQG